jgi:spore coat protein JB
VNCDHQREQLLERIQALSFSAVDLNLYLDTHPCDLRALTDYNQISSVLLQTKAIYEQLYGPMLNFGLSSGGCDSFRWVEEPWPWQIGAGRVY